MTETIEIEVSDEDVAHEVGIALLGRGMDIHDNPDDEFEDHAEELADLGTAIMREYGTLE